MSSLKQFQKYLTRNKLYNYTKRPESIRETNRGTKKVFKYIVNGIWKTYKLFLKQNYEEIQVLDINVTRFLNLVNLARSVGISKVKLIS